jgi:hypothetical protein
VRGAPELFDGISRATGIEYREVHGCGYALANAGHDTRALQALALAQGYSAYGALHRNGGGSLSGISGAPD